MKRWRRWFPAPLLSALVLTLWLTLARSVGPGQLAIGLVLAVGIPRVSLRVLPPRLHLGNAGLAAQFVFRIAIDVIASNLAVGRGVILWRRREPAHRFVRIPLDLRDPVGLAALAVITTIVPGTVWSELATDRTWVVLHVWDAPDPDAFIAFYKARYEQPLREIFE
jgi:multicomponent K+:H+ antiporter subunit E